MSAAPNPPAASGAPQLVRAIGRWTLTALVVNGIIGSGIFGLPDDIAREVGLAAPIAYLLAAVGIGVIMACFAEVASQYSAAGGPYLYAREAYGQFAGIQMGWFAWLVRLTSAAANANIFVEYFGHFWEPATTPAPRAAILTVLVGFLTFINIRGVRGGARVSNFFTVAKLLPIAFFIVAGMALLAGKIQISGGDATPAAWGQAVLALMFAFGGFEAALVPMAEAKNPRRDAPFALFTALGVVTVVYMLIHVVSMAALPELASSRRPVSEAAEVFIGGAGAALIAAGVMISTYGYLSGQLVSAPRLTYAFAEQGDFPKLFANVHPRFRTPWISILVYGVIVLLLAIFQTFFWNAIISAVARLFTYAIVCAALITFRLRRPQADAFRLPAGWLFALLGVAFCVVMIAQMNAGHAQVVGVIAAIGVVNWLVVRRRKNN